MNVSRRIVDFGTDEQKKHTIVRNLIHLVEIELPYPEPRIAEKLRKGRERGVASGVALNVITLPVTRSKIRIRTIGIGGYRQNGGR